VLSSEYTQQSNKAKQTTVHLLPPSIILITSIHFLQNTYQNLMLQLSFKGKECAVMSSI
jgi:hypothetical protein